MHIIYYRSDIMENPFNVDEKGIYTIDQVAKIIKMSSQSVTRDIRHGHLKAYKLGEKTYRVCGCHLLEYLNLRFYGGRNND